MTVFDAIVIFISILFIGFVVGFAFGLKAIDELGKVQEDGN